jgi:hypothetical protein
VILLNQRCAISVCVFVPRDPASASWRMTIQPTVVPRSITAQGRDRGFVQAHPKQIQSRWIVLSDTVVSRVAVDGSPTEGTSCYSTIGENRWQTSNDRGEKTAYKDSTGLFVYIRQSGSICMCRLETLQRSPSPALQEMGWVRDTKRWKYILQAPCIYPV